MAVLSSLLFALGLTCFINTIPSRLLRLVFSMTVGVVLQSIRLYECVLRSLAVGIGASEGELFALCNGPGDWNVYGEDDSTVRLQRHR